MHQVRSLFCLRSISRVQDQQRPWRRWLTCREPCLGERVSCRSDMRTDQESQLTVRLRLSIQTRHGAGWTSHPLGAIQKESIREQCIVAQQLEKAPTRQDEK